MSRQAEAAHFSISAEQIARIRQAIRYNCPNGSKHRLISLTWEELAALSEMLRDAEARLWAEENALVEDANLSSPRQAEGTLEVKLEYAGRAEPLIYEEDEVRLVEANA